MNILAIIPARYGSSRFPGKPLAIIHGKTMIQRVYMQTKKTIEHVVVATDDQRIADNVKSFGGEFVLTNPNHNSGTDRCAEALQLYQQAKNIIFDVVINIQGDEPFIDSGQISQLANIFNDKTVELATLIKPIDNIETLLSPNRVKVVVDNGGNALYFSRQPIPYIRASNNDNLMQHGPFYLHIGMYGYTKNTLQKITKLGQSRLELAESLEQLRWLENGYKIRTAITNVESLAVDTPEDLQYILNNKHI